MHRHTWKRSARRSFRSRRGIRTSRRNLLSAFEPLEARRLLSTVYVDASAPAGGTHDGTSWAAAYFSLQQALSLAGSGTEIRIADGTYKPTTDTDRTISFVLMSDVALYGGYAGYGAADPDARDVSLYATILSGDTGTAGVSTDNSYHVVTANGLNATAVLDGFTITAGYANGSGALRKGAGMYSTNASPTVANCTFSGNTAISTSSDRAEGGGMYNSYSSPTLSNCVFRDNMVYCPPPGGLAANGGGIANYRSSPRLTNCTFTGNSADWGGGIDNYWNCYPTLTDCTFSGNTAGAGGAMYNSAYCTLTMTRCTFSGNSTDGSAGAIYNGESGGTLTDCTFSGNSAGLGGAMENRDPGSSPTLIRCTFSGNSGTNLGGAIWNVSNASPTLTDCTFAGNSAANDGGALYNESNSAPTLTNCTFTGNAAEDGGAIYGTTTLTNCTFEQNTATNRGGAVSGAGSFTGCTFSRNTADGDGGAVYGGSFTTDCGFIGNSAGGDGGGIWTTSPVAPTTLANCTFVGNAADDQGGGMYLRTYQDSDPAPVANCTFAGNTAGGGGGGIFSWNDSLNNPKLANCIFWGNTAPAAGEQIDVYRGLSVTFSDIQGGWVGTGNMDADPLFVRDPSGSDFGDLRLRATSACLDAGDNAAVPAGVTIDLDGNPRFVDVPGVHDPGAIVDMGAYEYQVALSATAGEFLFDAPRPTPRVTFGSDLDVATLSAGDLLLRNLTTGQTVDCGALATVSYDPATRSASWAMTGTLLADGDYRATLPAGSVSGIIGGAPLAADFSFDFFVLAGDSNRDRRVNLLDFNRLAANFGQSPRTFSQGDFNYDSVVDLLDFNKLAARFGTSLDPGDGHVLGRASGGRRAPALPLAARLGEQSTGPADEAEESLDLLA